MIVLSAGVMTLVATAVVFRWCLPRDGQVARFVGTEWEPYVAVTLTTVAVMGVGFILLGLMAALSAL